MQFNRQPMGWKAPEPNPASPAPSGNGEASLPGSLKGTKLFQPKAFPWNGKAAENANSAAVPKAKAKTDASADEPTKRIYEVLEKTTTVRAEPHIIAKMKTKKSKGARVFCCEVTLNGWLKLEGEPGYMITDMRGLEGVGQVARCVEEVGTLAVPDYQPQSICCMEVVHKSGASVFEAPSRKSKLLSTRRLGEYVFAQSQNFDNWVKLASPDAGWVQLRDPKSGDLLRLRRTSNVHLWVLSDTWNAARKTRQASFGTREVQTLKDLERRVMLAMSGHLAEVQETGSVDKIMSEGLLTAEDLEDAASRVRCKLFANIMIKMVHEEAMLRDLMPNFAVSDHPALLPATEQEEEEESEMYGESLDTMYGAHDAEHWGEGMTGGQGGLSPEELRNTQPFIYGDKVFRMAPNGVLFDPPNEVPVGLWNATTQQIEPAAGTMPGCPYAMLSYFGKQYVVMPDNSVIDPSTEEVVGILNQETNQIESIDPIRVSELSSPKDSKGSSKASAPPLSETEAQQIMAENMQQGEQMAEVGAFEEAALSFGVALDACRRSRSIDIEVECDILRKRSACWARTGRHKELLEDAERILSFNDEDKEADEWRRMASFELLKNMKADSKGSGKGYDASWRNTGVLAKPGAGPPASGPSEKCCAYCLVPVTKPNICSKCRRTYYCGRACQRNHWKVHKHECGKQELLAGGGAGGAVDDDDGAGMEELD